VTEVGQFFAKSEYHYEHGVIDLRAFFVKWVFGEMTLRAHDELRWVDFAELQSYELAPADIPIAEKLALFYKYLP